MRLPWYVVAALKGLAVGLVLVMPFLIAHALSGAVASGLTRWLLTVVVGISVATAGGLALRAIESRRSRA